MQEPGKSETDNGCWDFFSGFYLCSQKKCQADCRPISAAQFHRQIWVMFMQRLQQVKTFFVFELRPASINTSLALEFLFLDIALDANKFSQSLSLLLQWSSTEHMASNAQMQVTSRPTRQTPRRDYPLAVLLVNALEEGNEGKAEEHFEAPSSKSK